MSIQRQKRIQSFPLEVREYNPELCFRQFSDMCNLGDWQSNIAAGATGTTPTLAFESIFSKTNRIAAVARLTLPADSVINANVQVRDGASGLSPALEGGVCEADFMAKVKYTRGSAVNTLVRVGFYDDSNVLPDSRNALCFFTFGAQANWQVGVYSNWTGSAGYKFTKDTGVSNSAWNTLSIWASADGQKAVFQINDDVVHVQDGNMPLSVSQTTDYRAGTSMLATGAISSAATMDIDFQQFRYFTDRSA